MSWFSMPHVLLSFEISSRKVRQEYSTLNHLLPALPATLRDSRSYSSHESDLIWCNWKNWVFVRESSREIKWNKCVSIQLFSQYEFLYSFNERFRISNLGETVVFLRIRLASFKISQKLPSHVNVLVQDSTSNTVYLAKKILITAHKNKTHL